MNDMYRIEAKGVVDGSNVGYIKKNLTCAEMREELQRWAALEKKTERETVVTHGPFVVFAYGKNF